MDQIFIDQDQWQQMRDSVSRFHPEEACGLLAGKNGRVVRVFEIENELHSPVRFRMEPQALLQALLKIDQEGDDLIAIFHSHPSGPDHPSKTDIDEFTYPGTAYLIWYQIEGLWNCKAYRIMDNTYQAVKIEISLP